MYINPCLCSTRLFQSTHSVNTYLYTRIYIHLLSPFTTHTARCCSSLPLQYSSSLPRILSFSFCSPVARYKGCGLLTLCSHLNLILNKYFPMFFLSPLHLYSSVLSYKLHSHSYANFFFCIQIHMYTFSFLNTFNNMFLVSSSPKQREHLLL
jgi:hypothetical protein